MILHVINLDQFVVLIQNCLHMFQRRNSPLGQLTQVLQVIVLLFKALGILSLLGQEDLLTTLKQQDFIVQLIFLLIRELM